MDVALWLDSRSFVNKPSLRIVGDFVIVNSVLHNEFESFKRELNTDYSIIEYIKLLRYWIEKQKPAYSIIDLYEKQYVKLHCKDMDKLCRWIMDLRNEVGKNGLGVFKHDMQVTKAEVSNKTSMKRKGIISAAAQRMQAKRLMNKPTVCQAKRLKMDVPTVCVVDIDSDNYENDNGDKWLSIHGINLSQEDKSVMLEGRWLNDKIIHAAQLLIKHDPDLIPVGPLQHPLCGQSLNFNVTEGKILQIINSGTNHWITISTTDQDHSTVQVYDSLLNNKLPFSTKEQIAAVVQTSNKTIKLEYINIQVQIPCMINYNYCKLFF